PDSSVPRSPMLLRVLASAAILMLAASAHEVKGQASQPIYLQYDGFVKNKDGTYTLSFGYFNTNHVDVRVEPGQDNSFTPGPADRNQPILFLKGRHRFACSMVLPADFNGRLQWTVQFGGQSVTTTAKTLDPLYELELNSEKRVVNGLDLATTPKGVCFNHPPSIQVINPFADVNAGADTLAATSFAVRLDQELSLDGNVDDDGLPRDSKLAVTWKKSSGPGEVTFSDEGRPVTRARFSVPGAYELELSAGDTERTSSVKIRVTVHPADPKK
ncbi:MAG TPA: hypothetical protein VFV34_12405, partial [Blastocatellia bacterium]|nr:hypothetical protein [Blastocatellia bacterium]